MTTIRKHLTLRNIDHDLITEEGIDKTIDRGLARLIAMPLVVSARLISAIPVFGPYGVVYVTMLVDVEVENP